MYLPHPLWSELVTLPRPQGKPVHQDLDHICGMSGPGHCNTELNLRSTQFSLP